MQQLEQHIHSVISKKLASGDVEKTIEAKIGDLINQSFDSIFSRYGSVQEAIQKGLEEKIKVDLSQIELPEYSEMICDLVQSLTLKALEESARDKLCERLKHMLSPAPKEITTQQFLNKLIKEYRNEDPYDFDDELTVEIDRERDGYCTLKIWKQKERSSSYLSSESRPDIHLYLSDGVIRIIHGDANFKESYGTANFNAEAMIYMMYCGGTKFTDIDEIDPYHLDRTIRDYD